jgi:CheY-like chemotaxis protein
MRFNILAVDDNELVSLALSTVLSNAGFDVYSTFSGAMALSALQMQAFDLLIVDLQMPQMDGFALLEQIKGQAEHRALPALMLTASDDAMDVARARRLGARGFLSKPFKDDDLVRKTRRILTSPDIAWIDDYHCLLHPIANDGGAPAVASYR